MAVVGGGAGAGEKILEIYARDFEVEYKGDDLPLTEADQGLQRGDHGVPPRRLMRETPIISEENRRFPTRSARGLATGSGWWIHLDGTKEFIKKNGEFTVNIALVEKGRPVLGVVYRPGDGDLVPGSGTGEGAWRIQKGGEPEAIHGRTALFEKDSVQVVASRSHLTPEVEAFVEEPAGGRERRSSFLSAGSSLKLCLVAEGEADVYPRFGPTMEWDTGGRSRGGHRGRKASPQRRNTGAVGVQQGELVESRISLWSRGGE